MKILNYSFKLEKEQGFSENKNSNNINRNLGIIDYKKQIIRLDPDHPEATETLVHELIHAVAHFWNIEMSEDAVMRLGIGITAILTENGVDLSPLFHEENK